MENRKNEIENRFRGYIERLEEVKEKFAQLLSGKNSQFFKIKNSFVHVLDEEITLSYQEMQHSINCVEWNRLVIAFFGETNAGKSTIIETIRILCGDDKEDGDGCIIGDGRTDYTKDYAEYNLQIDGKSFVLIDTPGIQGDEEKYEKKIKEALRRAHIVFYVHGHAVKPDNKVAKKIKDYLSDWVNVYSLYNVKGNSDNYDEDEDRVVLYTDKIKESEELIVSIFKEVLGVVYKGNVTLQALLALCSIANFAKDRTSLIRAQETLIGYFGNKQKLYDFSCFEKVQDLVKDKSNNFITQIVEANELKVSSLAKRTKNEICNTLLLQQNNVDKLESSLKNYKRDVSLAFSHTKKNISVRLTDELDSKMDSLRRQINKIIESKDETSKKTEDSNRACNNVMKKLEKKINGIVEDEYNSLKYKLDNLKRSLDADYRKYIISSSLNSNIINEVRFDNAMKNMDIGFDDCLELAGSMASGAWVGSYFTFIAPGIATAIGAFLGAVLYKLKRFIFGDGGRNKAKEEVSRIIYENKRDISRELSTQIDELNKSLDKSKMAIIESVDNELRGLKEMKGIIYDSENIINEFIKD